MIDATEALRSDGVDITADLDVEAIIRRMSEFDASNPNPSSGFSWFFSTAPDDWTAEALTVGIRGDVGALMWYAGSDGFVPGGTNTEHVEYYTIHTHVVVMPPGAEVSTAQTHEALREFFRTRQRPTCVEWRAEGAAKS